MDAQLLVATLGMTALVVGWVGIDRLAAAMRASAAREDGAAELAACAACGAPCELHPAPPADCSRARPTDHSRARPVDCPQDPPNPMQGM